jgi:nitrous oxidase accessory protein NosD
MTTRRVHEAAAAAATVVIALSAAPLAHAVPVQHHSRQVVAPGQSVQSAVDRARPGDVIVLLPGVYRGSVQVTTPRLTIHGSGARTVITPGGPLTDNACARAGFGLCVTGTAHHSVSRVHLRSLTVTGFRRNGIDAAYADRLHVTDVTASHNGEQGISQEHSERGVFHGDTAIGNGQAGIFVANSVDTEGGALDTRGTVVRGNRLTGNRFGVVLRRVRDLTVERNLISGNCGGVFVIGDENVPRAGKLTISGNQVLANNKFCASNGRLPFIQGTGILLTGTEQSEITRNQVTGNVGRSPMSGGIVLYGSNVGVHNTGNTVVRNVVTGNSPADLNVKDTGKGNTFTANTCASARPVVAGRCG